MRKSNKEAAETRRAIVTTAADHIRRTGIAEASLSDIMAGAGLTHGGFYKHFRNREQLIAEALVAAGEA
ncbi:TetR family transcriptional regulator, partial [Aquabacter sp. CN5-332]